MYDEVRQLVAEVLKLPLASVSPECEQRDLSAWDSQAHLDLILHLESRYSIELTLEEALQARSIPEIAGILKAHGVVLRSPAAGVGSE